MVIFKYYTTVKPYIKSSTQCCFYILVKEGQIYENDPLVDKIEM